MLFNNFVNILWLIYPPVLSFIAIAVFNLFILYKIRPNYYFRNVFRRIKILNKKSIALKCNSLFKTGLSEIEKIARKNNKILLFSLIFHFFVVIVEFIIIWNIFYDESAIFLLIIIPGAFGFGKLFIGTAVFGTTLVSKKMIKKAKKGIEKWKFDSQSFHFDKEYQPNGKKTKNVIIFINPGQRPTLFSLKYFEKYFKGYDLALFYFLIWGIHFPQIRNVKFESLDVYQDFVNLYAKTG
ncbi:Uncharacterised protein [Mesomycoplasma dispar]|uniref:Uncharacterized protein n=1 Tax=Mesomycoplasma dispar TaxID=86660 RepID=A0AAJ5TCH3_9BACT|nr:hypothetical protein [Mesomycoplasma dispar]AJR12131.1 hypothetical protein MDIS_01520 [Mesomycoplasma dispar]VEU61506.1 Uncharacterised protein [Mesomycoplasma dispar]